MSERRTPQVVSAEFKRPIRDLLEDLYVHRGLTQYQVAKVLNVNVGTVCRWMQKYGIPARRARWEFPDQECASL